MASVLRRSLHGMATRRHAGLTRPLSTGIADDLFKVSGLNVAITGGAQGIGRVIAEGFASRGCRIFVIDFQPEKAQACAKDLAMDPSCLGAQGIACDVREEAAIRAAADAVKESLDAHGAKLDVLINCAGVTKRMPAEDFPLEEFDRIMMTNYRGSWYAAQRFGQMMLEGGGGCIVNIDSVVTAVQLKHVLPYAMSKAGVQALTKGLALEWGPKGVRVNGIAPGLILTPISQALWSQPHMQKWAHDMTPLGRMGCDQDLVGTALFLASPASKFIQGQTIRVDGGMTAGCHWPIDEA